MSQGERLQELRQTLGLKQKEFATRISSTQTYVSAIETGKKPLTEKLSRIICYEFKVNYEWLVHGEGSKFDIPVDETMALVVKLEQILRSNNPIAKKVLISLSKFTPDEWIYLGYILNHFNVKE